MRDASPKIRHSWNAAAEIVVIMCVLQLLHQVTIVAPEHIET